MPEPDLRLVAEILFRLVTSFATTSSHAIDVDDDDALREFATKFLAPLVW
ncbi:hypothetical protein ACLQ3C_06205 [Gordonia sp. DT30]